MRRAYQAVKRIRYQRYGTLTPEQLEAAQRALDELELLGIALGQPVVYRYSSVVNCTYP